MTDTPKVSVIIPSYNRAHFVGEAIQSILDQTFPDFEVIVVDDGSTDNTKDVVTSFKDPRVKYTFQENRGIAAARNTGIKATSGEYVAFLDSDDLWLPQHLELKVRLLDSRPEVALVCSDNYVVDYRTGTNLGTFWHRIRVNPERASRQPLRELLSEECFISLQSTLVRRSVFAEVGYLDESLRLYDDWDICVRIAQRFSIETIDMPLVTYRVHGTNPSKDWDLMYPESLAVLYNAIQNYSLSKTELGIVKRRIARNQFRYGRYKLIGGEIALGREKLLAAVKLNPWCIKPYIYLAGSLLGSKVVLNVNSWKKRLERLSDQHKTPSNTQSGEA